MRSRANTKEIGERIRQARVEKGWSMRQLARRTSPEVSHTYISLIEQGAMDNPGIDKLMAIAHALGLPLATLLGEERHVPTLQRREPAAEGEATPETEELQELQELQELMVKLLKLDGELGSNHIEQVARVIRDVVQQAERDYMEMWYGEKGVK
jgi:transcriptional regulator with XRE-family HTH domain